MAAKRTLGAVLTELRTQKGWTLKEMGQHVGIPVSTLSKVEHDRLSLTYDKLQQVGERLNIRMSDLFAESEDLPPATVLGRRSIGKMEYSVRVDTPNYEYNYLCPELRSKRMVPVLTQIHATSITEFGELVRHPGEEFVFVIQGSVVVHTEFYDPITLEQGESIYIDSGMGHAYVRALGCELAMTIGVMAIGDEDLSALASSAKTRLAGVT